MTIKVSNEIKIYEIGGKKEDMIDGKKLMINSHWNRSEMVCIEFPGFSEITVGASDLEVAVKNARNISRN